MSECDICADRELGSCCGAPEKSPDPRSLLFPLSIQRSERGRVIAGRASEEQQKGSQRKKSFFCILWILEVFSFYLRMVSLVQHVSRGML